MAWLRAVGGVGGLLALVGLAAVGLLVVLLAPWRVGLILDAAEVRALATLQLRTVVWGVLAMAPMAVLAGIMRGRGTVLLPALLGLAAVLLIALPLAMWLQATQGLPRLWLAWPLGLLALLAMPVGCFRRWRPRVPAAA